MRGHGQHSTILKNDSIDGERLNRRGLAVK